MKRLISKKLSWIDVKNEFDKIYPKYKFESIESIDVNKNLIRIKYSTTPQFGVVELPNYISKKLIENNDISDWV